MIVTITGHRPEKLPSKTSGDPNYELVEALIGQGLRETKATYLWQGMAAGVDLHSAKVAYNTGVPYACARPWSGHKPRNEDAVLAGYVLKHADKVEVVCPDYERYPGAWVYQRRNEYMVDRSDVVLAIWDGYPKGGTYNAVRYALSKGKKLYRVDPNTTEGEWVERIIQI